MRFILGLSSIKPLRVQLRFTIAIENLYVNLTVKTKNRCYCSKASWKIILLPMWEEVTLLRCLGSESHFKGKNYGFTRFLQIWQWLFQETVFPQLFWVGFSVWMYTCPLPVDLSIGPSAVHVLCNACVLQPKPEVILHLAFWDSLSHPTWSSPSSRLAGQQTPGPWLPLSYLLPTPALRLGTNTNTSGFYLGAEFRSLFLYGTHLPSTPWVVLSCVIAWRRGSQRESPQRTEKWAGAELMHQATRVEVKSVGLYLLQVSATLWKGFVQLPFWLGAISVIPGPS